MAAVITCQRGEHKDISQLLFQLLSLAQQSCNNDRKKRLVINQLNEKLVQLDVLIAGAHHLVEELMQSPDEVSQQLVDNMLGDHEMLDVFSELLLVRIQEYLLDDGKKTVMMSAVNHYVKQHIQYINREQTQLFKLCEIMLTAATLAGAGSCLSGCKGH
ncbi:MAG: hypothetical protein HRU20_07600 [Pseudomonadales bacterium]|nr:hypothetical protein [Pseudomonadales bacterium]